MANNRIQVKRTSTAGRTPNTTNSGNSQYIAAGEFALNMADGILYSSNGSAVIEVGANNTNQTVTGTLTINAVSANGGVGTSGQVLKSNGTSTYWATDNADVGAANQILYRNSSNTLTTSSGLVYDGTSIKVNGNLESVYQNGDEGGEIFLKAPAPANTSIAGTGVTIDIFQNKIRFFEQGGTNRGAYIDITSASAGVGSNLLAGGGGGGTVNVAAQYVWTNLHTFSANVSISANAIGLTTNTSAIYFAGTSDANWKMGRNTGAFTKWKYTNNSVDIAIANSNLEGFTIGNAINPGNSFFETGYLGTFIASNVTIGNSSVNASINSTAFTGTSNNASSLGGTAAANFVQNTDSRTLSGNLVISGTYFNPSANTILLGNSTQRWVLSATSGDFSSTVNAVTSVNSALLTVGASFIANTTGAYHTGTINAASVTTTGITVNTSGVYPTSNTSGQGLGTATQRFDAFLDVVDVSGAINTNAGANAIVLSNNTSQFIVFAGGGSAAPTNTTRSPGTKIVIWPSVGASSVDYGIGTDNYVQWYSVGQTIASHVWYANTTNLMVANTTGLYHIGTINAASHTVGTSFTANSTVVNAVSYYAGTLLVANTTVVNATHLSGKTEGNLNVNNSTNFNGQSASYYTNATNITTGTLPYAQIPANIANTTGAFTFSGVHTYSANIILGSSGLSANGSFGTAGQVLHSNGTATYWSTDDNSGGTVTSISAGNGVTSSTGGAITTTGTLYIDGANGVSVDASGVNVLAGTGGGLVSNSTGLFVTQGTGTVVNATGVHVNSTYIGTIASNSALYANASITNSFTVGTSTYFVSNGNVGIGNTTPAHKLRVDGITSLAGNTTITGFSNVTSDGQFTGNVGIGIAPSSTAKLYVADGAVSQDTTYYGILSQFNDANTAITANRNRYSSLSIIENNSENKTSGGATTYNSSYIANYGLARNGDDTTGGDARAVNVEGGRFYAYQYADGLNSNTVSALIGTRSAAIQQGSGVVTGGYGLLGSVEAANSSVTGNVTTAYGVHSTVKSNTSMTIDTGYLYYGQHAGTTTGSNPAGSNAAWGIYLIGEDKNYFSGNVGIGTTSPSYTLQVNGSFAATTKSFVIDHPTKPDMKLRYGSLEGPENGVYVRGKLKESSIIKLPDYWWNLIDPESITVNLTPYGSSQDLWVQSTSAYNINLNQPANCFFTVFAERKDVEKLVVEF